MHAHTASTTAAHRFPHVPVATFDADVPLRSAPFSLQDRWFLWSRAQLYADRIELHGWLFSGRYDCSIQFGEIRELTVVDGGLAIDLTSGRTIRIELAEAGAWASAIGTYREVHES